MTLEQQRAIALANARARASAAQATVAQAAPQNAPPAQPEDAGVGRGMAPGPMGAVVQLLRRSLGVNQGSVDKGVADSAIRAALGVKTLAGGLSPEQQAALREQEADAKADPNSGSRTTGRVVGDVLMSAVPASKAAGAVGKVTGALPSWLAPAATAASVSGGQGMIMNPGHGETWGEQMVDKTQQSGKDAALGGALGAGGQLLRKALTRMFTPKEEAEALFRQGINPTLQQGAEGKGGRLLGGLTSGAVDVRARQEREIEDAVMRRITGGQAIPGSTRREAVDLADEVMERDYTNFARNRRVPISPTLRRNMHAAANPVSPTGQFQSEARDVGQAMGNIVPDYPRNINVGYRKLQNDYAYPLSEAAEGQKTERAKQAILRARDLLIQARNRRLTSDELADLKAIDVRNYDFNRLKEAAAGPGLEKEGITLAKLEGAYSKAAPMTENRTAEELIGPAARVIGPKPTQDMARTLVVNAKRGVGLGVGAGAMAGNPLAQAAAPFYLASLASQTVPGAKFMMGQYEWQKALAEASKRAAPFLSGSGQILSGEE